MEIISNTALISINETLIIQVISFLIFLFLMNRLMFRPLQKTMGDRDQYLTQISREISDAEKDVARYTREIEKRKSAVQTEASKITQELEKEGNREAETIVDAAVREVAAMREATRKKIEVQIAEARQHLQTESMAVSIQLMEKILDRRLSNEAG